MIIKRLLRQFLATTTCPLCGAAKARPDAPRGKPGAAPSCHWCGHGADTQR